MNATRTPTEQADGGELFLPMSQAMVAAGHSGNYQDAKVLAAGIDAMVGAAIEEILAETDAQ